MAIIPAKELNDALLEEMYTWRAVHFEDDEALEEIASLEHVLDAFDANDRIELQKEIHSAKTRKLT